MSLEVLIGDSLEDQAKLLALGKIIESFLILYLVYVGPIPPGE